MTPTRLTYPCHLYKDYASTCTFNTWLKIYSANKSLALWMLRWTKFSISKMPYHVSLAEYIFDSRHLKELELFLDDYSHIGGLTIPSQLLIPEIVRNFERFPYLIELIINVKGEFEFPLMNLRELETLFIFNSTTHKISRVERIQQFLKLTSLYLDCQSPDSHMIQALNQLHINILTLVGMEIENPEHLPTELFVNKEKISLVNCGPTVVEHLLNRCGPTTTSIFIENKRSDVDIHLSKILTLPQLNSVKIRLEVNCIKQYSNLLRILHAIPTSPSCKWVVIIKLSPLQDPHYGTMNPQLYSNLQRHIRGLTQGMAAEYDNVFFALHMAPTA